MKAIDKVRESKIVAIILEQIDGKPFKVKTYGKVILGVFSCLLAYRLFLWLSLRASVMGSEAFANFFDILSFLLVLTSYIFLCLGVFFWVVLLLFVVVNIFYRIRSTFCYTPFEEK